LEVSVLNEQYMTERLNPQINYYNKKSVSCQRKYHALSIGNIVLTALIPVITMLSNDFSCAKYTVALAGAVASILSSVLLLKKYKETWLECRITCEILISERETYRHSAGVYKTLPEDERDTHFIERCEEIMSSEHSNWASRMKKDQAQL